jgi:hypothetical protein
MGGFDYTRALNIVVQGLSKLAHGERKVAVFDETAGPDHIHQCSLINHPRTLSNEFAQDLKPLERDVDLLSVEIDGLVINVEDEPLKFEDLSFQGHTTVWNFLIVF